MTAGVQAASANHSIAPNEPESTRTGFMSHVRGFFNCSDLPKTLGIAGLLFGAGSILAGIVLGVTFAPVLIPVGIAIGAGLIIAGGVALAVRSYQSRHSASDSPPAQEVTGRVNATFVSDEVGETNGADEANEPSVPENMQEEDQKSVSSNTPQPASADNISLQDTGGDKKSGIENPAFERDEEISGASEEKAEK